MPSAVAGVVLEAGSCIGVRELDFLLDLQELLLISQFEEKLHSNGISQGWG